jgi:GTPase
MQEIKSTLPTVAIVGRANVGKSTLFNRLTETRGAVVAKLAGTTRDRKEGTVLWRGKIFRLIDTGGLDHPHEDAFEAEVHRQATIAINEADVVLFVVDLNEGALEQDRLIAEMLSDIDKPVLSVGNKADRYASAILDKEWYHLPLDTPRAVSATRGNGLGDLLDDIFEKLTELGREPRDQHEKDPIPRIAFIGIPNVGKSSIINEIIGSDRFITSPIAHTTREANDTLISFDDREYIIVDTAGIRRKSRIESGGIEHAGVRQSKAYLRSADVAVLVIDAGAKIESQEKRLARMINDAGVGCIIAANKWDLTEDKSPTVVNEYEKYIRGHLPHIKYAPLLTISAKDRQRIHKLFPLFDIIMKERARRLDDRTLETFLRQTIAKHKPARGKGIAHPEILNITQTKVRPPTFRLTIKGRRTDVLHPSYNRFLENRLREQFGFTGTPIEFYSVGSKARKS